MKSAVLLSGLLGLVCLGSLEAAAKQILNGPYQGIDLHFSGVAPDREIVLTAEEFLKVSDTVLVGASIPPALLLFVTGIFSLGFLIRRRKR